jgi:hypothetical protein
MRVIRRSGMARTLVHQAVFGAILRQDRHSDLCRSPAATTAWLRPVLAMVDFAAGDDVLRLFQRWRAASRFGARADHPASLV